VIAIHDDIYFMRAALVEAQNAFDDDEVPIGCVIVRENRIIARGYNQVERLRDSTAHAEMIALTQAEAALSSKWLNECTVYVTIEPCLMCAYACVLARIKRLVYGAPEPRTGAMESTVNVLQLGANHTFSSTGRILEAECAYLMQEFFKRKRAEKKVTSD
jgi:tRNA(adenine34) deaminase